MRASWTFPTLVDLVRARAVEQPECRVYTFLRDDQGEETFLTYEELDRRARAIGASLQSLKTSGDRVLLIYPPGLDFIAAFYGCLYAGAIAVPVPPPGSGRNLLRLESIAADSAATVVLGTDPVLSLVKRRMTQHSSLSGLHLLSTDEIAAGAQDNWQYPSITADTLAFLQYTSGSTGAPKGVMMDHGNLIHNSAIIAEAWHFTPSAVHVLWMPTFHDLGLVAGVVQAPYSETFLVMLPPLSIVYNPMLWLQTVSRRRAAISGGMNFGFELCVSNTSPEERATLDLSQWRLAYCGGDMVHQETVARFIAAFEPCGFRRRAFCAAYGLAESTLLVTSHSTASPSPNSVTVDKAALERGEVKLATPDDASAKAVVSCGRTLGDQQVAIVHPESLQPCTVGQIGEVWIAGPSVARGYWHNPHLTEQTFNAFLADGQGPFVRTGDLGFYQSGELFITGRLKDLIIVRGRNLYPSDIERTLEKSHWALRPGNGAVFSIQVGVEERLVVAHEVDRHCPNTNEIIRCIRQAIVEEHEVKAYAVVLLQEGTIPKTSSGKIARRACREAFLAGNLKVVYEWQDVGVSKSSVFAHSPQPDLGKTSPSAKEIKTWLVSLLARQLSVSPEKVAIHQPLTYHGLDSADIVNVIRELELWLGRPLPPTLAWNYPTVEQLAQHLAGNVHVPHLQPTAKASRRDGNEPIAIVGLGCRFPGAKTPQEFYELLHTGTCIVVQVPAGRWDVDSFYDPNPATPGKMYTRYGSFLDQVDQFDPYVFEISPREAATLDPQHRLLLEVAWEALENAGQAPDKLKGSRTGVFVGMSTNDYYQLQLRYNDPTQMDIYAGTGNALTFGANRLSYLLDLKGPSLAIDTACSSSLVAVHLACQSLRHGESDVAIAGGVNVILSPEMSIIFCNLRVLAADGRCKTFDAAADGYTRGEGCGLIVLKRLSDAIADSDQILALILGSAVNQDGRSNGLTAPNGLAQQAVINEALADAGVSPSQLSYIEAHGTGTPLGDPIEVEALATVLARDPTDRPCFLGSVKTNIGHLEPAAGIAGLIKTVLSMQHKEIFPHLNLKELNPHISLENTRLVIPTERQPWPAETQRQIAGVSAFALGGTNAHLILETPPVAASPAESRPWCLLPLSAKTGSALETITINLIEHLKQNSQQLNLPDVAYTLQTGRAVFRHRRMLVCQDVQDAINALASPDAGRVFTHINAQEHSNRPIVFVFPDHSAQYVHLGRELYQYEPIFRDQINRCAELLEPQLGLDLSQILYPKPVSEEPQAAHLLCQTCVAQPALFAIQYALARLLMAWGIHPQAMIGHCAGEYVAACLAGVLSLEDALALVAARGRLLLELPDDSTSAVASTPAKTQTSLAEFAARAQKIKLNPPQIPYVSNLTGDWIQPQEATDPSYYIKHLHQTARFTAGLNSILAERTDQILLTIGPEQTLPGQPTEHTILSCLPGADDPGDALLFLLNVLGQLWLSGVTIDWSGLYATERRQRIALPTYPFERQRYWIESAPAKHTSRDRQVPPRQTNLDDWFHTLSWQRAIPAAAFEINHLANEPQTWLIFVDEQGLGAQIADQLSQMGQTAIKVMIGTEFNRANKETYTINPSQPNDYDALIAALLTQNQIPQQIVHLWSATPVRTSSHLETLEQTQARGFYSLLFLVQALGRQKITSPLQIGIVSSGVQDVTGQEQLCPEKATILGLGKTIPLEYPHITCRNIDIVISQLHTGPAGRLANQLIAELIVEPHDPVVAYRGIYRWVQTLTRIDLRQTQQTRIKEGRVYLITGGLGGIGLTLAEHLAQTKSVKLALLGRSRLPEREKWQQWLATHDERDAVSAKIQKLQLLEAQGVQVLTISADVADLTQMQTAIAQIQKTLGPINGVIHAAGIADTCNIQSNTPQTANQVLRPKLQGALVLQSLLQNDNLDFLILFSSIASILGGFGLVNYCAANAFLDRFASHYTAQHNVFTVSINWDHWLHVGLFAQTMQSSPPEKTQLMIRQAHGGILPQEGIKAFQRILSNPNLLPQVIVSKREFQSTIEPQSPLSTSTPAAFPESAWPAQPAHPRPDLSSPYVAPRNEIEQIIAGVWQKLLGLDRIGIDDNFFELGGNSLVGAQVITHLKRNFGIETSTVILYETLTIRALANTLHPGPQAAQPTEPATTRIQAYQDKASRRKQFQREQRQRKERKHES